MSERNTTWDRERDNERDDWQREEAWRQERKFGDPNERYRDQYRQQRPRGDYGPSAFNPGRRDQELFGTGNRGYGTTWGGSGVYSEGRNLYQGDQRNYQEGQRDYQGGYYGGNQSGNQSGNQGRYQGGSQWGYQGEWQRNQMQGQHSGKGPKGYRRSDERIREEVCDALTQHGHIDASEIEIRVKDGEVTLTGTVERREEKRMAEDAVERVTGVREIHNQLRAQGSTSGNPQTPGVGQSTSGESHLETSGAGNRRR